MTTREEELSAQVGRSLKHLQRHLPWTLPYSGEFEASATANPYRRVTHDLLHVMKSLGRVAADCEKADHARPTSEHIAREVADFVICALHIAKTLEFDLEAHVVASLESRNGVRLPAESAARIEKLEAALRSISTLIVDHEASPTFTASNLAEAVGTARAALAPAGDAKVCETCGKPATCHIGSGEPFTCREHCPDCAGDAKKGTP